METMIGTDDYRRCPECILFTMETKEEQYSVWFRCPSHVVTLQEKIKRACEHASPWTIERHKRGMIHDRQMGAVLDRLIKQKRWEMGLAPAEDYGPYDYGIAHPG